MSARAKSPASRRGARIVATVLAAGGVTLINV
jgi:hypothetical protein